jgi:hypothetical protein
MQEQPTLKFISVQVTGDDYRILTEIARQDAISSGATSVNLSASVRRMIRQDAERRQLHELATTTA